MSKAKIVAWVCGIGFVVLAIAVMRGLTLAFDEAILNAIHSWATPFWDSFFVAVTNLGGTIGIVLIGLAFLFFLLRKSSYRYVVFLVVSVLSAVLINTGLKLVFQRPRPELWEHLVVETSYSFPSGHTVASSALAFAIIIILWRTRYRIPAIIAAAFYMTLVGFSRLYLGVHYPTDILGAWLESAAIVALIWWIIVNFRSPSRTHQKEVA